MVERVKTGIHGLDELIQGGLPETSVTLVSGGPGTGKTLFCSQFLWTGLMNGENCLFITMEEEVEDIIDDAAEFGWDFRKYIDEGRFKIDYMNPFRVDTGFEDRIRNKIEDVNADRIVIDSTSVMGMYADSKGKVRRQLYDLIKMVKKHSVTCIMTAEIPKGNDMGMSRYGVEEFVSDGVIMLKGLGIGGEMGRKLIIQKMRKTKFEGDIYPLTFKEDGLHVEEADTGIDI